MLLRVRSITYLAQRINGYELVDPDECDLPGFTAGAHVSVRVGDGPVRDFSLHNDPAERARYCIAVLREPEGQGSREWHEHVRVGDIIEASMPRNNFPLAAEAEHHLLIAGGIGITPIMSMIAEFETGAVLDQQSRSSSTFPALPGPIKAVKCLGGSMTSSASFSTVIYATADSTATRNSYRCARFLWFLSWSIA